MAVYNATNMDFDSAKWLLPLLVCLIPTTVKALLQIITHFLLPPCPLNAAVLYACHTVSHWKVTTFIMLLSFISILLFLSVNIIWNYPVKQFCSSKRKLTINATLPHVTNNTERANQTGLKDSLTILSIMQGICCNMR